MRMLPLAALMVVLPLSVRAQTDPAASSAVAAPAEAPAAPDPAAEASPPPADASPPIAVVPAAAAAPRAPIVVAPPAGSFAPQPSPLVSPIYGAPVAPAAPPPRYVAPPQTQYAPPPQTQYAQPPPVYYLYAPPVAPPTAAPPRVDPPVSLPALPPGYVYIPMPLGAVQPQAPLAALPSGDVARREELYARLHDLDVRLDALQSARPGLGGPIALMVIGYGATLVASSIALGSANAANEIKHDGYAHRHSHDYNHDGVVDHTDYRDFVRAGRIAGAVAGAGLLIGLGSTIRLFKNIAVRREQASELRGLQDQRRNLRQQLDYGASFAPNQLTLSLNGRF